MIQKAIPRKRNFKFIGYIIKKEGLKNLTHMG